MGRVLCWLHWHSWTTPFFVVVGEGREAERWWLEQCECCGALRAARPLPGG
jgi:hypothetical protein